MNINVPPDSKAWLFAAHPRDEGAIWSFRYPPPTQIHEPLFFRFGGVAVARAIVFDILKPGDHDNWCHNGKRYLSGWKVVWLWSTFEDLRDRPDVVAAIEREAKERRKRRAHAHP